MRLRVRLQDAGNKSDNRLCAQSVNSGCYFLERLDYENFLGDNYALTLVPLSKRGELKFWTVWAWRSAPFLRGIGNDHGGKTAPR